MKLKRLGHKRLAEGEATGHFHAAVAENSVLFGDSEGTPRRLDAPSGTDVVHQEHGTITLPPGSYDRSIIQEFDHAAEEARNVID